MGKSLFIFAHQIIALMDKNDELIDGNMEKEVIVKDEWIFERKINYSIS